MPCRSFCKPHTSVLARGLHKRLATGIYLAQDRSNGGDLVLFPLPEDRRAKLMVEAHPADRKHVDCIRLREDEEAR
jgi:protocatechuate 3,4-dioxygenase beta subunit